MPPPAATPLRRLLFLATPLLICTPALAGMPSITLTHLTTLRLEVISFFLLMLLLSALGVRAVWNALARDFPRLPRLSFTGSLGLMTLWGLLFTLVLTMISGARELMTPGAWEPIGPAGLTQRLRQPSDFQLPTLAQRKARLELLKLSLFDHARAHGHRLPQSQSQLPPWVWETTEIPVSCFVFLAPGLSLAENPDRIIAAEPSSFPEPRHVLFASGRIELYTDTQLDSALARSGSAPPVQPGPKLP